MAEIVKVDESENNKIVTFQVPTKFMKYILPKGFIALDGASLTVIDTEKPDGTFTVALIPETLRITTFGTKTVGDKVNFEIDSKTQAIVDTIENYLSDHEYGK